MNWREALERYEATGELPPAVSGGKGGNSKAEMERANQISDQQLQLQKQQLGMQQSQLAGVNSVLDPLIKAGGMTPAQEAALTSLSLNNIPQNFAQSRAALNQDLVARGITGGPFAGGGEAGREFGGLYAMENALKQQSLSQIQLQKQQQLMQALQTKMGIGGQYGQNVSGFGNQGINALGIGQQAAQASDTASSNFWGSVIGAAAGMVNPIKIPGTGCWIARIVYGADNPLWLIARERFSRKADGSVFYCHLWNLYQKYGERLSRVVKRSRVMTAIAKQFFDGLIYA